MKEIKFTTHYEQTISLADSDFKIKYEEFVGDKEEYETIINGDIKHLALCPRCNNQVVILGIYKKIDVAPHARHARNIDIPNVVQYDEYKYLHCPYHIKHADYIKEYVPETDEPQRQELYRLVKEHYDKAIYVLQKGTGIYITNHMAEMLAKRYVLARAYNYIDATIYNIPWYLIYSFYGFPLYHMIIKKGSMIHKQLVTLSFHLKDSRIKDYVYVENNEGYLLMSTNYRYAVDEDDCLNEWLDFSIIRPNENITDTLLYTPVTRFSIKVDSEYFNNLIDYEKWHTRQDILDIAAKYMNP